MTNPSSPKSLISPPGPHTAQSAPAPDGRSAPKDVARQDVPSALRSDPQTGDGQYPIAWLHITTPGRSTIPTAHSWCACGHDRSTIGHRRVLALITDHQAHRDTCPLRNPQERRNAA